MPNLDKRAHRLITAYAEALSGHDLMDGVRARLALRNALDVVVEFIEDVEAVGIEGVRRDWPDLAVTYANACEALGYKPGPTEET